MEKDLINELARSMQRQHAKEMLGEIQKWEKLSPTERSTWRLMARSATAVVQNWAGEQNRKPEARKR